MLILMNVLNVYWWISWITDSTGGRNCSTSRTDQGIVGWGWNLPLFSLPQSGRLWDGVGIFLCIYLLAWLTS